MRDLHAEMDLRQDQAEAIARGLYAVARADGTVHPREAALISDFFGAATGGDTSALSVNVSRARKPTEGLPVIPIVRRHQTGSKALRWPYALKMDGFLERQVSTGKPAVGKYAPGELFR